MADESTPPELTLVPPPPPSPDVCPRIFCFHYLPAGGSFTPDLYPDLDAAIRDARPVGFGHCCCTADICTRLGEPGGDADWYEPHEPALERAGLPWFFFIASGDQLTPERREEYVRESARFWGEVANDD